jgi:hypothetical protein
MAEQRRLLPGEASKLTAVFELGEDTDAYIVEATSENGPCFVLGGTTCEVMLRTRLYDASASELTAVDNLIDTLTDWRKALAEIAVEQST